MLISSTKPYSPLGRHLDGMSGVYALIDPRSKRTMYVGQSLNIGARYRWHCDPDTYHDNVPKTGWFRDLRKAGLVPVIHVIARTDDPSSLDRIESETIRTYRLNGECELNITTGGRSCRAISKMDAASRDDWRELGRTLSLAQTVLDEAELMASAMMGASSPITSRIRTVLAKLVQVRSAVYPMDAPAGASPAGTSPAGAYPAEAYPAGTSP